MPPIKVEYASAVPVGFTFVTNRLFFRDAFVVTGKSVEVVKPATYALPAGSTAIALASSSWLPPRYPSQSSFIETASNLAMKAVEQGGGCGPCRQYCAVSLATTVLIAPGVGGTAGLMPAT